jgi:ubiquinone/menaquinone biosynthesis C-methylase UbiE
MVDEAREQSRATWNEMAPGWERKRDFMWATTRHVTEWLIDHVDARAGDTILDVAGGPGEGGFLAAERVGPTGRVIETDFAPQMVDVARRRAAELGLTNVEARVVDAEDMDLADDSVDGILCRWGFMLMLDPQAALGECRRVLKAGRRLALSVWGGPEKNPWITIVGMTMIQLGHQPGGDPFRAGGMFSMSDPERVRSMLADAGFGEIVVEEMAVDWNHASFDDAWDFMTEVAGAIARVVKELPRDEVHRLRDALEANVEPYRTDSGITLPGVTVNAWAS